MNDDGLLDALRLRARAAPRAVVGAFDKPMAYPPVSMDQLAEVEARLGLRFPSLLRRIYLEVADGGFGPGYGFFPAGEHELNGERRAETLVEVRETLALHPRWSSVLLPLCDWGCASWSCLDCGTDDGAIVTVAGEHEFTNTGDTLRSWLRAWLDGVALWETMFEAGPTWMGINPFSKQPLEMTSQGKPKGTRWP
jgi:SMI1 / KNR4 family (SUKH-1)